MSKKSRIFASVTAAAALSLSLAACSDSAEEKAADKGKVVAEVANLTGESTAVNAELTDGSLVFPITGGNVTYYKPGSISPYVQGEIKHSGSGFSLASGGTTVELTDFTIDPGTSQLFGDVSVNGKSAVEDAFLFKLDGRTLKPLQTGANDTAILEGTKVEISKDAAPLLNDTFKTNAIKPGLLVGIAKITINTK